VRHSTLVVDIGGGTSDIAFAHVGGRQAPVIHRAWGLPNGGTDVDLSLSMAHFMPLFGRGDTRVPAHHFVDAAMVQDMPRQRAFHKRDFSEVPAPYNDRLQALQHDGGTTRLYRGVEAMKMQLSDHEQSRHELDYIDAELSVAASRADLTVASVDFLGRLSRLLREIAAELATAPDSVFLTGGMSRAPYVRAVVRDAFPHARVVHGDPSLGVVSGLANYLPSAM
jgi:hypothetical chaperone protein